MGSRKPGPEGLVMSIVMCVAAIVAAFVVFSGALLWIVVGVLVLINVIAMPSRLRRAKQSSDHSSSARGAS